VRRGGTRRDALQSHQTSRRSKLSLFVARASLFDTAADGHPHWPQYRCYSILPASQPASQPAQRHARRRRIRSQRGHAIARQTDYLCPLRSAAHLHTGCWQGNIKTLRRLQAEAQGAEQLREPEVTTAYCVQCNTHTRQELRSRLFRRRRPSRRSRLLLTVRLWCDAIRCDAMR
jgi:hypothetical protein